MEASPKPGSKKGKILKLLLKIAVTIACLWYVATKINFTNAAQAIKNANWFYLFIALVFFIVSKTIAALRLNLYFRDINIHLPGIKNIKLYWLGMFYNLFLPGAISGDAYKVVVLTKKYNVPYRKTAAAVLIDRFSGLVALGLILAGYGIIVLPGTFYAGLIVTGAVLGCITLYLITRFWFSDYIKSLVPTFFLGVAVQVSQVVCIYFILLSLHLPLQQSAWIFIFLAAAVITVLPLSLGGGLGTREFVFREGALFFLLNPNVAVVISLLFYLCTVVGSLPGLYYVFNDPLKNADPPA